MTDDHDHDHEHEHGRDDETADDPRPRVRALQSLLVEKGVVSTDAIDEAIAAYEHDIGPLNGARIVARAWTDPAFERRLLEDANDAIDEFEFDFDVGVQHVEVKKNTENVHNAVVCTLCSCYPWSLLGLPPTWYKTPSYRSRMVREPRSVLAEFGVELEDGVDVNVWDSSSEIRYMVLPRRPEGTEGYDESALAELVTRDAMIGVERLGRAPATDGGRRPTGVRTDASDAFADLIDLEKDENGPTFSAPWQARAFGLAVALYDEGDGFDWASFQGRLIEEVEATDTDAYAAGGECDADVAAERTYYEQWQAALERLVVDAGAVDPGAIDARAAEFADGERTAEEFVEGTRTH